MGVSSPTVSVIIPTYYRNDLLREAVQSVLEQDHEPVELIVVDDSGEANAAPVADAFDAIRYVALDENRGENPARDAGLDVATGRYVQFLDDDDLLRPDKLSRQLARFDDRTGVVYSGFRYYESGAVELPDDAVRGDVLDEALAFELWPPCFTSTLLVDRSVLEATRPLRHHGAGDTTFLIGLAKRTEFDFVDEPLVEKRVHVDSLGFSLENTSNKRQLLSDHETLYRQRPTVRAAALFHIYSHEGRIRMADTAWSPRATAAFARAAYHAPSDTLKHAATCLGSVFGRSGVEFADSCYDFAVDCREHGPLGACRRATRFSP